MARFRPSPRTEGSRWTFTCRIAGWPRRSIRSPSSRRSGISSTMPSSSGAGTLPCSPSSATEVVVQVRDDPAPARRRRRDPDRAWLARACRAGTSRRGPRAAIADEIARRLGGRLALGAHAEGRGGDRDPAADVATARRRREVVGARAVGSSTRPRERLVTSCGGTAARERSRWTAPGIVVRFLAWTSGVLDICRARMARAGRDLVGPADSWPCQRRLRMGTRVPRQVALGSPSAYQGCRRPAPSCRHGGSSWRTTSTLDTAVRGRHPTRESSIPSPGTTIPGMFGRMFPTPSRHCRSPDAAAEGAGSRDEGRQPRRRRRATTPTSPQGFTYLGQFIDHDITLDLTSITREGSGPARRPRISARRALDLDSMYGLGPGRQPAALCAQPAGRQWQAARAKAA